ncbi:hypothetical protein [Streptomyces californicus]|uniref:hypothetical protein n=1 Tax=Streptomyces californicus TaxID=67351 RepID=UPI0033FD9710
MARVRYLGPEPATVPELGGREVQPDEIVEVPDQRFEGYVCQTSTWESIEEPRDWVWPEEEAQAAPESAPVAALAAPPVEPPPTPKKTAAAKAATSSKEG